MDYMNNIIDYILVYRNGHDVTIYEFSALRGVRHDVICFKKSTEKKLRGCSSTL